MDWLVQWQATVHPAAREPPEIIGSGHGEVARVSDGTKEDCWEQEEDPVTIEFRFNG